MNPDELLDELMALTRQDFTKLSDEERAALAPRIAHKTNQFVDWIGGGHPLPTRMKWAQRYAPAACQWWPWVQGLVFDPSTQTWRCKSDDCAAELTEGSITHDRDCTELP